MIINKDVIKRKFLITMTVIVVVIVPVQAYESYILSDSNRRYIEQYGSRYADSVYQAMFFNPGS